MSSNIKYPFEQVNVFSISLSFSRKELVPEQNEIPIYVQIKIIEPGFPRIQVNMIVKTPLDTPVSFSTEAVSIFDYVGDKTEYQKELNQEFINEKALYILWTYIEQLVRIITGQMGMNPVKLKTPISFDLQSTNTEKSTD